MVIFNNYNQLLSSKHSTVLVGLVYIIGGQLLFYLSMLEIYQQLRTSNSQIDDEFQSYFYWLNLNIQQCAMTDITILISFTILALFMFTFYLAIQEGMNSQNQWYRKIFPNAYDFFTLLGFYPAMISFASAFGCINDPFNFLDQNLIYIIVRTILSFICIILLLILTLINGMVFYNQWNHKKDALTRKKGYLYSSFLFVRYGAAILISQNYNQRWYYMLQVYYYILTSICLTISLTINLNFNHFHHKIIRQVFSASLLLYLSLSVGILISIYCQTSLFLMTITLFIFILIVQRKIVRKLRIKAFFTTPRNLDQLLFKIQVFQEFQKKNQELELSELIYFGDIYHHLARKCDNVHGEFGMRCFCSMKIMFDSKQQKDVRKTIQAIRHNRQTFTKQIIKSWFETLIQNNPRISEIRFCYSIFLYFKMNNKLQALQQIKLMETQKTTIIQRLRVSQFRSIVHEDLKNLNSQAYFSLLDFEYVIQMEHTLENIYSSMMKIINSMIFFWRKLTIIPQIEDSLIKINSEIETEIIICNQYWNTVIRHQVRIMQKDMIVSYLEKKQKWKFIYLWYKLYLLNEKVRVAQFENLTSSGLDQEIINEDSDSDYEVKAFETYNKLKPFNKLSIIINSLINGHIVHKSKSCQTLLEYDNLEVINQILPEVIQRNHLLSIKTLIQTGKSQNLYKTKRIFVKHSHGHVLLAKKYLKWYLDRQNQLIFIAMIRPVIRLEQLNYIIVNSDWEVDSVTCPLLPILEAKTCLLLLCTGLFQFSHFAQFLGEEDFSSLKIMKSLFSQSCVNLKNVKETDTVKTTENKNKTSLTDKNMDENDEEFLLDMFTEDKDKTTINNIEELASKKFFKIVDEQHIKLILRVPRKLKELNNEYRFLKLQTLNSIVYNSDNQTMFKQKQKLVFRDQLGRLKINKLLLYRRLYDFKQRFSKEMLENLKDLFERYCSKNRLLEKVIKLDASIQFSKTVTMDKFNIIKINKYEIFEYNQKRFQETTNRLSESKINRGRPSLVEIYMDPQLLRLHQQLNQVNNSEVDSNRIDQNKSLLTEGQVFPEFIQYHPHDVKLNVEKNIFLKQDNNRISIALKDIYLFIFLNRIMMLSLYLMISLGFSKGPAVSYLDGSLNEIQEIEHVMQYMISVVQLYEYSIDSYLIDNYSNNITTIDQEKYIYDEEIQVKQHFVKFEEQFKDMEFIEIFYGYDLLQDPINDELALLYMHFNQLQKSGFKLVNQEFDILEQFRSIITPTIQDGLIDSLNQKRNNFLDMLANSQNFATFLLITAICFVLLYHTINSILIVSIIQKNKTILKSFRLLSKKHIVESMQYAMQLRIQLQFLIDLDKQKSFTTKNPNSSTDQITKYEAENEFHSDQKNSNYISSKKWMKLKINLVLLYFILNGVICSTSIYYLVFQLNYQKMIQQFWIENEFTIHPQYLYSMISIKELYINQYIQNTTINVTEFQETLSIFMEQVSEDSLMYETNIEEVYQYFFGNVCSAFQDETCTFKLAGSLTRGLYDYNMLLSQIAQVILDPTDTRYSQPTIDKIFEFSELQYLAYLIADQALQIWSDKCIGYAKSQIIVDIVILSVIFIVNSVLYYIVIEKIVVKKLQLIFKGALQFIDRYYSNDVLNSYKNIRVKLVRFGIIDK